MVVTIMKSVKNKALILLVFSSAAVHAGQVVSTVKRNLKVVLAGAAATVGALGGALLTQAIERMGRISFVFHDGNACAKVDYVYDSVQKTGTGYVRFSENNNKKIFMVSNFGRSFKIKEQQLDAYSLLAEVYNGGNEQVFDCTNFYIGLGAIGAERIDDAVKKALIELVTRVLQS